MTADQERFTLLEDIEIASTLQGLIDAAAEALPSIPTGTARKAEIAAALDNGDLDELIALQEKLEGIIDRILDNKIDLTDTEPLTATELYNLMVERLDQADVQRLLEIRYQMIRARVFAHITAVHRLNDVPDPEHAPGEAPVPELKKRFTREGGRGKATLDFTRLAEMLGPERSERVFRTEVIPEHTETRLDEDALLALVAEEPALLMTIKDCVVPGGYRTARFHIRPMSR